MNAETENLVLRALRRTETSIDGLREDTRQVKTRLGILEQRYASTSNRVDRIEFRLDRVETRIHLVEA